MVTCRSPARSPLAGGYGEGPKHFFQVDSTQREPQSISAVPPHLVALIEFNVFLRSPFDRVHSLRGGGGEGVVLPRASKSRDAKVYSRPRHGLLP